MTLCWTCLGNDSAAFGYGTCPSCGGLMKALADLEEVREWESEIEHRDKLIEQAKRKISILEDELQGKMQH